MLVIDKVFEIAQATPDKTALVHDLEPTTFADFYRLIRALQRFFAGRDLRAGGVAAMLIDNLRTAWIADLALRGLGLTTVAVKNGEDLFGLTSLDITALVTVAGEPDPGIPTSLFGGARRLMIRPEDWTPTEGALEPPPPTPTGDHILLTSATTGHYKMVRSSADREAANAQIGLQLVNAMAEQARAEGRTFSINPMINLFSLGLWTTAGYGAPIPAWTIGGGVVLHQGPDPHLSLLVPGLVRATLTPALLSNLLDSAPDDFPRVDTLQLNVTGGPLSAPLAARARARLTNHIVTALGSTESGGWASTTIGTDEDLRWHTLTPGRVVEVVDEADDPLPPMKLGQVRILADNGFTGYLNDPAATAAFLRHGYFYPGDLGVLDGKGRIALYGRVTDVLNVMGDKLATGPFEQAMEDALGVDCVCLFSEQGPDGEESVHAVIETPTPIDEARLRAAALAHLSRFPFVDFHFLERLPRNHMGKVERLKLKQRLLELKPGAAPREAAVTASSPNPASS